MQDQNLISSDEAAVLRQLQEQKPSDASSQSPSHWNWMEENEKETKYTPVHCEGSEIDSLHEKFVSKEETLNSQESKENVCLHRRRVHHEKVLRKSLIPNHIASQKYRLEKLHGNLGRRSPITPEDRPSKNPSHGSREKRKGPSAQVESSFWVHEIRRRESVTHGNGKRRVIIHRNCSTTSSIGTLVSILFSRPTNPAFFSAGSVRTQATS